MDEQTALTMSPFPRVPCQKREPEDRAKYAYEHDAEPDLHLSLDVEFPVGKRFLGMSRVLPAETSGFFFRAS